MSPLSFPTCTGTPRCPLGSVHNPSIPSACRGPLFTSAQRQPLYPGLLLTPQLGRRNGLCTLASSQKTSESSTVSFLAPLPKWCHRLAGAFVLVPFLALGGSRNAIAQSIHSPHLPEPFPAASVRVNPLYETSTSDLWTASQTRAAASVAAVLVGYGFVRSSAGGTTVGGGSLRSAVAASAVATSFMVSAPPDPLACSEELSRLSNRLNELERRNDLLLARARELMELDASLGFVEATYKAAESLDLDASAAEAAIAANARTAVLPSHPSGGASHGALGAGRAAAAAVANVTATAAAAVAAEVQAGVPMRPSGGASRLAPFAEDSSVVRTSQYAMPERRGGASVRSGPAAVPPLLPPQVPQDSSRVPPGADMVTWAGEAIEKASQAAPPVNPTQVYSNPLAETSTFQPRMRPTRRASGSSARAQRTYRTIAPPSLPPPPPRPINPSFDVPEDSLSPEEYLSKADGRTSDGRVNPSFASADVVNAAATAAPPVSSTVDYPSMSSPAAGGTADPAESAWYNPLSWFTQQETRGGSETTNPSFDSSLAVDDAEMAAPQEQLQQLKDEVQQMQMQMQRKQEEQEQLQQLEMLLLQQQQEQEQLLRLQVQHQQQQEQEKQLLRLQMEQQEQQQQEREQVEQQQEREQLLRLQVQHQQQQAQEKQLLQLQVEQQQQEREQLLRLQVQHQQQQEREQLLQLQVEEQQQRADEEQLQPEATLVESLLKVAEEQAAATGEEVGFGAAAAASSAAWSEALTEGAAPGDFAPVVQVSELLEVAMKTEEFRYSKYDPLRNALASATAPSVAHKYDMLRGLLRAGKETTASEAAEGQLHKYDLIYDLLQSVRTSGDPEAILAAGDPKYDPIWCLLNMREPTRGSLSKYDLVGSLLQAALGASPQPSRYDPLQVILQAKPPTGSFKYCMAEVLLHGGWQAPLESGLADLPSWDPLTGAVGSRSRALQNPTIRGRRTVSKYDMVGQALEAMEALPKDLASGKWAASQPRDPILGRRARVVVVPRRRQRPSKYDMVGQALQAAVTLPEDLASGKWSESHGRELFIDTVSKAVDEGRWDLWQRLRNGGAAALGAVTAAVSPVTNFVAKAAGLPYEIAPGVVVKVERSRSPPPSDGSAASTMASSSSSSAVAADGSLAEVLPTVLYQFKRTEDKVSKKTGEDNGEKVKKVEVAAGRSVAPSGRRRQRVGPVGPLGSLAVAAPAAPQQAPRLDRAVVPPLRSNGRRVSVSQQQQQGMLMPDLPFVDNEALREAIVTASEVRPESTTQEGAAVETVPMASVGLAVATEAEAVPVVVAGAVAAEPEMAVAAATSVAPEAAERAVATAPVAAAALPVTEVGEAEPATVASAPAAPPLALSEMAVDLLVVISIQSSKGNDSLSMEELVSQVGPGFVEVAAQLQSLQGDGPLISRHPSVARLVRAASKSSGDGTRMWSHLYDMMGAVRDAELAMPAFLEDCRAPYPLVHGLLTTGDPGQGVSVLCALCNLLPSSEP